MGIRGWRRRREAAGGDRRREYRRIRLTRADTGVGPYDDDKRADTGAGPYDDDKRADTGVGPYDNDYSGMGLPILGSDMIGGLGGGLISAAH
jgi:hypothetical protein